MKYLLKLTLFSLSLVISILNTSTVAAQADQEIWDPLESFNRGIFWFNDQVDTYFMEPVAKGYDYVMPQPAQKSITNFFSNLSYPGRLLSAIVQLDFSLAANDTGRFLINSTAGVGGLFDIAENFGLKARKHDLGVAFASYDIPHGPYLVLPFYGPTTVRDGIGKGIDGAIHPFAILNYSNVRSGISDKVTWYGLAADTVQTRSNMLEAVESAKESSLDYYLFVQSAYYQYRRGLLNPDQIDGSKDNQPLFNDDPYQDDGLSWEELEEGTPSAPEPYSDTIQTGRLIPQRQPNPQ